ncbi:ESX secretion-associated protein EspG [Amycolatopsis minnesotensis]|uniref:ESX secretion-associated protein EspG n=1 Tax=Amycolatopsis minnesotensis TaxID=337894 RepID=A0ABN2Q414_9PSEU
MSASAFDILWHDLGLGAVPEPLDVHSVGYTGDERADIRREVYGNLAERGLYDGRDPDPEVVERLAALAGATASVECEALVDVDDEVPFRAVAAGDGRRATLAVQPSRTIGLSAIRPTELATAIMEVLPWFEPGPGLGVSLPASALEGRVADPVFAGGGGGRSDARDRQLSEVLAIQARPVLGAGQFSVRVRTGRGASRRVGGVSWFVTDVGAYLGSLEERRGGQAWVSVIPADAARVAGKIADLLDEA